MNPIRLKLYGPMYSYYTPSSLTKHVEDQRSSGILETMLILPMPRMLWIPWEEEFESRLDRRLKIVTYKLL